MGCHYDGGNRPEIICLCGSTRFYREFQKANYEETMAGRIVLTVGFFNHASLEAHGEKWGCTPEQKIALDKLHLEKIKLADTVVILNVDGYIGESTRRELAFSIFLNKEVRFLETDKGEAFMSDNAHALGQLFVTFSDAV